MKLAVLTSGGDSAGMNAVVRAVVKTAIIKYDRLLLGICVLVLTQRPFHRGCETRIVPEGYESLVRGNDGGHHHGSPHNLGAEKSANGSRSRTPTGGGRDGDLHADLALWRWRPSEGRH